MNCEETRVDIRIPNPESSAKNQKAAQVMFQLNHTMPFTEEYNHLLQELFGDNLGEGSYVAAPISGACVNTMKIGKGVFINSNLLAMADGIQECLETVQDIKACNQEEQYLRKLDEKMDRAEKAQISSELVSASLITTGQMFLRLICR